MRFLDGLPIGLVYLGGVALLLLIAEIGFRIGRWMREKDPTMGKNRVTSSLVGGLMALMAFLMAMTIGTVVSQHVARRDLVVTEANAVGTAFLRAGYLEEPAQSSARELLKEYVEVRLAPSDNPELLELSVLRSEEIQSALWLDVEEHVLGGEESPTMALYVESINAVFDVHLSRITAAQRRLPTRYGQLLITAMFFSFLLVGIASSADKRRAYTPVVLYALAFMAVFLIIIDLDRPQEGHVVVSQQAMETVLRRIIAAGY